MSHSVRAYRRGDAVSRPLQMRLTLRASALRFVKGDKFLAQAVLLNTFMREWNRGGAGGSRGNALQLVLEDWMKPRAFKGPAPIQQQQGAPIFVIDARIKSLGTRH